MIDLPILFLFFGVAIGFSLVSFLRCRWLLYIRKRRRFDWLFGFFFLISILSIKTESVDRGFCFQSFIEPCPYRWTRLFSSPRPSRPRLLPYGLDAIFQRLGYGKTCECPGTSSIAVSIESLSPSLPLGSLTHAPLPSPAKSP